MHRRSSWLGALVVLGAGSILGVFLSRAIAETPCLEWPFYRWGPTIALTLVIGAAFPVIWGLWMTRAGPGTGSVAPFIPFCVLLLYVVQPEPNPLQAGVLLGSALVLSALLIPRRTDLAREWLIALLLFFTSLAAYISTLTPAVGSRDGYELQAISATLGFAHPTGYPLFPILGRLWIAAFPFGSIAWRINVLCALFAAASVPLVYATARRVLGRRSFAVLGALLFAFSHTLWTQASQPEKYTLNALFVSLILYVAFGITDPERHLSPAGPYPYLRWLGFVYGLSLTHHRTVLMLAPALAVYVLWRDPHLLKRPREWAPALGIAVAPLLIYLYIPWRARAQGWAMTVPEFLTYISGAYYGPAVRLTDWLAPDRAGMFWRFLVTQFGYPGIGLGVLGLVGLGVARRWRFLVSTALAYVAYYVWGTGWYAYYNDVNSFIPNHMLFAMWIASGAMTLWKGFRVLLHHARPAQMRWAQLSRAGWAVFWSAVLLMPASMVWKNAPQVDVSDEWGTTRWGEYAISQDIASNATLLADREKHPPLDYFARVEGRRPDLDVVILGDENAYRDRLTRDLSQGKTVYLARFLPGLEGPYHLRSLGPLVEVGTEPLAAAGWPDGPIVEFGGSDSTDAPIRLLGYEAEEHGDLHPGDSLLLTLFWQAVSQVPGNYQVNLRLVSAAGQVWWASSDHPVSGMYPSAAWKPGEVIPDWHEVPIVGIVPPGEYTVELGLFLPFAQEGLVGTNGQEWVPVHRVRVASPLRGIETRIAHPLRAIAPGRWQLLGYDLPRQAPPTGRVPLTLYWQSLGPLPDYQVGTRLITPTGETEWVWVVPGNGEYPTSEWLPRTSVVTRQLLTMPAERGPVTVQVAVRESPSPSARSVEDGMGTEQQGIAFFPRWLGSRTTHLSLPPLEVSGRLPAAPGTVNYDDRILLLEADVGHRSLQPGSPLEFDARWECMRAMDADYTLFVQILAPDGTLKGQIDVWPKDGTHPTSRWREGEIIEDTYLLYINRDAPPGAYQVAIGWYLLETMQRLPVLDAEGRAVDDKVLIQGLTVVE